MVTDISETLATKTGSRIGVQSMQQDICSPNMPMESFDLLVSSECIEHTESPERALIEMSKLLKPGGFIIVTSPNRLWIPSIKIASWMRIRNFSGIENWLFPKTAIRTLQSQNLNITSVSGCHLFPWQIPFAPRVLPIFDRFGTLLYPVMINYGISAVKPAKA
jgi:2-polyprenyl-3-methyl-5-hydroxy-6-metoxy-1,4-benzoquinol methylase